MNIFYLDEDPKIAAQMMCNKHVVKMILESAQMLCTTHRVLDDVDMIEGEHLYKMAHKNHPSTIWVRSSWENYMWLYEHMVALMQEYTHRYDKHHATERLMVPLYDAPINIPGSIKNDKSYGESGFVDVPFTEPPQCMPDYCKEKNTVNAYRSYYIKEKSGFAKWKRRKIPEWFNDREFSGISQ
jgi:hypothetical protein